MHGAHLGVFELEVRRRASRPTMSGSTPMARSVPSSVLATPPRTTQCSSRARVDGWLMRTEGIRHPSPTVLVWTFSAAGRARADADPTLVERLD